VKEVKYTPAQLAAIDISGGDRDACVVAGPGSGSGQPQFVVTRTLSRNGSNNIVVVATVTNTGSQPAQALEYPYVTLAACKLGSQSPIAGPTVPGYIAPGASAQTTITFPGSAGASGATVLLTINGTWFLDVGFGQGTQGDGGSFGYTSRTVLP